MSIASKIERLQTARTAIRTAIINQGGTSTVDSGFEDFSSEISTIPAQAPEYTGPYTVTPQASDAVVLATNGKTTISDITVNKIGYSVVDNPQGGQTATIAS